MWLWTNRMRLTCDRCGVAGMGHSRSPWSHLLRCHPVQEYVSSIRLSFCLVRTIYVNVIDSMCLTFCFNDVFPSVSAARSSALLSNEVMGFTVSLIYFQIAVYQRLSYWFWKPFYRAVVNFEVRNFNFSTQSYNAMKLSFEPSYIYDM